MHRTLVPIAFLLLSLPGLASAQASPAPAPPPPWSDAAPAQHYAHGSFSLGGGAGALVSSIGPTRSSQIEASATGRWVARVGFAVTANVNVGGWYGALSLGSATQSAGGVSLGGSVGVGWAFAVAPMVAITPEVFAGAGLLYGSGVGGFAASTNYGITTGAQLPIEVFVGRHAAIEPMLTGELNLQQPGEFILGSGVRVMFTL